MAVKGYLVCRECGNKEPQSTYDCDVPVVCKECDVRRPMEQSSYTADTTPQPENEL